MSRRKGQNPKVRVDKRADGAQYYFFQYWIDVPGQEERKRGTEVIGLVTQMTRSEAERKKLEFITKLAVNSSNYQVPSSAIFADAVKHYRENFGPAMHRENSTLDVWEGRIKNHLEADWKDVPIEHITIESVNQWAWKKRKTGASWGTIKDALRTMQRILSAYSKEGRPPFSMRGLRIPERDKLEMKIRSRKSVSYSWRQAVQIAGHIRNMAQLRERERYAVLVLVGAASGLRAGELLALKLNDIDLKTSAIRVDGALPRKGEIGPCKNAAAYRTVLLRDVEGRRAMRELKRFLKGKDHAPNTVLFHTRRGGPIQETMILRQYLHPAVKALGFPKAGMHAFRRGCNRRWELAGINRAVIRQQMGHSSSAMTELYIGEIPLEAVRAAYSKPQKGLLEKMENEVAA
ncbi:MAG TPA: site-specific integrase [Candidatus Acidoferrum sp.]|nr:site-specific integrase [Candidatus Acidoferrum sp.]